MFDRIGRQDPPTITHPGFYYGFVGVALVWQIAFIQIARNPIRLRPMIIPSVLEKYVFGISMLILYSQRRVQSSDLVFAFVDMLLGILFLIGFFKTSAVGSGSS